MPNIGSATFEPWRGSSGNIGGASISAWTASGVAAEQLGPRLEAWTAEGTTRPASGQGVAEFAGWTATGELATPPTFLVGSASFEKWTAEGRGPGAGAATLEPWAAEGRMRGANVGTASFEPWQVDYRTGRAQFEPLSASGRMTAGVSETYFTGVMNSRSRGMTTYDNFPFNSYAKIGSEWYAAGPSGLYELGATDDNGSSINWRIKTGQMDDGDAGLKRTPEVLLGLRSNGKLRVRVSPNDTDSYEYIFSAVSPATIHQHRVKAGKGMRSRYYAVDIRDYNGSTIELDSMQVEMTKTTRRLGNGR